MTQTAPSTPSPEKPQSNSKKYLAIAAGCLVIACLCCVGVAGVFAFTDASKIITSQLPLEVTTQLGLSTPTPARPNVTQPVGKPSVAPNAASTAVAPNASSTGVAPVAKPTQSGSASAPAGSALGDAWAKAKLASKYRMEMSMLVGSTQNGKYSEENTLGFKGMVDGKNVQFEMSGGLTSALGSGATLEIISADGKTYMRGIPILGDAKAWYVMKDASMAGSFDSFTKPDAFDSFANDAKANDVKKVRSEQLDGQSCDVYAYDYKNLKNSAMVGMFGTAKDKEDFSTVDKSEINFWLCGDGYVHKFTMDVQAHNQQTVTEKGSVKMTMRLYDFNSSAISVTAPANAKSFPGQ
jgi:hypothetical protein